MNDLDIKDLRNARRRYREGGQELYYERRLRELLWQHHDAIIDALSGVRHVTITDRDYNSHDVTVRIDVERIANSLGMRALKSKGKQAQDARGAVVVQVGKSP
jgi:hypothetical protein